jgi:hypothetical protein
MHEFNRLGWELIKLRQGEKSQTPKIFIWMNSSASLKTARIVVLNGSGFETLGWNQLDAPSGFKINFWVSGYITV